MRVEYSAADAVAGGGECAGRVASLAHTLFLSVCPFVRCESEEHDKSDLESVLTSLPERDAVWADFQMTHNNLHGGKLYQKKKKKKERVI